MATITLAGYNDIKTYVISNWGSVSIMDDSGTQILRLATSDPRITWSTDSINPIVVTIVLKGNDSDLVGILPKTFGRIQLFKSQGSSTGLTASETFTNFTMTSADDQLTIKFNIEFPA